MQVRVLCLLPCVLAAARLAAAPASDRHPAVVQKADAVGTSFYSGLGGEKFACIRVASLRPARTRVGPFFVSSPGLRPGAVRIELFPVAAGADDWSALLAHLERLPRDLKNPVSLLSPDGRLYRLLDPPAVQGQTLVAHPATPPGRPAATLRIALDPDGRPALSPLPPSPTRS